MWEIPLHVYHNLINLYEVTKSCLYNIQGFTNQYQKDSKTEQQKFIMKEIDENKKKYEDNIKNIKGEKDIKLRRLLNNSLTHQTNKLFKDFTNSLKSSEQHQGQDPKEKDEKAPKKANVSKASLEAYYPSHPKTQTSASLKDFQKIHEEQIKKEAEKERKKNENKEARAAQQAEYQRRQLEIQYYNDLVEEEKKKAREARNKINNLPATVEMYPACPSFLQSQNDIEKYDLIMAMIHASKDIGALLKSIFSSPNPTGYNLKGLQGTNLYSMRHNDKYRYVIWEEEDGLKAVLTNHYKKAL